MKTGRLPILFIFAFQIALLAAQKFRYDNFHLVRLFPLTEEHVKLIENFEKTDHTFDIWSSIRQPVKSFDVLLPPKSLLDYKRIFESNNLRFEILDDNIQNKITEQQQSMLRNKADSSIINKYTRYAEIMSFIDQTVQDNSDIASSYIAGKSVESRLLKVIVLKASSSSTKSLWIDCGIHAREWVSPAVCIFTINRLINEYRAKDPKTVSIMNKYAINILPIVNPDGYEYTFNTMRLWRKNRAITYYSSCLGVDLNRNFGFKWFMEAGGTGASLSPCAETYCGEKAETEPEVLAVSNALRNRTGEWDAYINMHSFGNWWLLPYGYILSNKLKPSNYDQMLEKGKIGVSAIKSVNNETFVIGPSSDLLYLSSGSAADFAYGALNIPYSFIIELRPGPNSPDYKYGFTLPEDRLPLVTSETFIGIKEFFYSIV